MANIPIWPGSSSFDASLTPFSFYDSDASFQADAVKVADWCAKRLGYPLVDIELQAANFFTAFEEATNEYGAQLYNFQIINSFHTLEGNSTGSNFNNNLITPNMGGTVNLSEQYGSEADGSGGGASTKGGVMTYDSATDTCSIPDFNNPTYDYQDCVEDAGTYVSGNGTDTCTESLTATTVPSVECDAAPTDYTWNNTAYGALCTYDGGNILITTYSDCATYDGVAAAEAQPADNQCDWSVAVAYDCDSETAGVRVEEDFGNEACILVENATETATLVWSTPVVTTSDFTVGYTANITGVVIENPAEIVSVEVRTNQGVEACIAEQLSGPFQWSETANATGTFSVDVMFDLTAGEQSTDLEVTNCATGDVILTLTVTGEGML